MAGSEASVEPIDVTDEQKAMEMEVAAFTNIATCYLKLGEPRKTLEFCAKALSSNPNAWKAALRKSEAQAMMGNYDVSRITLSEALKIAPDAAAKSAIKIEGEKMSIAEKNAMKLSNSRQKKAFSKMFEREDSPLSADKPNQKSSSEEPENSLKPASF